jgi:1-acyl-sn-glycerol-3-phosphate acyltransferase
MIGAIFRYILKILYKHVSSIYYYKIKIINAANLPQHVPLLIVSNHSNAFWDAVMLAVNTKQKIWFLARSDVFKNKHIVKILTAIGIMPIYRMQEGYNIVTQNDIAFKKYYKMLFDNKTLAIFPEGNCFRESRLRPMRKGAARLAIGAMDSYQFNLPLKIVAITLNYDEPDNLGSEIIINIAKPIEVINYQEIFETNPVKAVNTLTNDMGNLIEQIHINIDNVNNLETYHFIKRNFVNLITTNVTNAADEFLQLKKFSQLINQQSKVNSETFDALKSNVHEYKNLLDKFKLREKYIACFYSKNTPPLKQIIALIAGFAPFVIGFIFNFLPYYISFKTAKKIIKKQEFFTSVNVGLAGILFPIWHMILFIVLINMVSLFTALCITFVIYFTGRFALFYAKAIREMHGILKIIKLKKNKLADYQNIIEKRNILLTQIIEIQKG